MNRTLKRVLGLAGSVALGLAGAVTFASAAQAHHPEVSGSAVCVDGGWEVTWEVTFVAPHNAPLGEITALSSEVEGDIYVGATGDANATLTGTQTFEASASSASLEVTVKWQGRGEHTRSGDVVFNGTCDEPPAEPEPETSVSAVSDCFGLYVVALNNSEALAEFTFTPSSGDAVTGTPEVGDYFEHYFKVEDPEAGLTVTVTADGVEAGVFEWDGGGNCDFGYVADTCDGIEFELVIPEDGEETTYTFTPSEGDVVEVVVAPGQTETVSFTATGDELTVHLVIEDGKNFYEEDFEWNKPEDCEEVPTESTSPAAQLPTTGSSMTVMVSAAAALVLVAAVLFFIARRRRAAADW